MSDAGPARLVLACEGEADGEARKGADAGGIGQAGGRGEKFGKGEAGP